VQDVLFSHNTQQKTEPPKFPRLKYLWAALSRDHCYFRRGIFGGSVL